MQLGLVIIIICIGVLLYSMYGSSMKEYYTGNEGERPILELVRGKQLYNTLIDPMAGWYSVRGQTQKTDLCRNEGDQLKCLYVEDGELKEMYAPKQTSFEPIERYGSKGINSPSFNLDDIANYAYYTDLQGTGVNNDICLLENGEQKVKQCYLVDKNGNVQKTDIKKLYPRTVTNHANGFLNLYNIIEVGDVKYTKDQVINTLSNKYTYDDIKDFLNWGHSRSLLWDPKEGKVVIFVNRDQYSDDSAPKHKVISGKGKFYAWPKYS